MSTTKSDASAAADGPPTTADSGGTSTAPDGGAAALTTCESLRNCTNACAMDKACRQQCLDRASAGAKTEFSVVTACTAKSCDFDDVSCRCPLECNAEGACEQAATTCRGFEDDPFCDELCR